MYLQLNYCLCYFLLPFSTLFIFRPVKKHLNDPVTGGIFSGGNDWEMLWSCTIVLGEAYSFWAVTLSSGVCHHYSSEVSAKFSSFQVSKSFLVKQFCTWLVSEYLISVCLRSSAEPSPPLFWCCTEQWELGLVKTSFWCTALWRKRCFTQRHTFLRCALSSRAKQDICLSLQMIKFNSVNELCGVIKLELDCIRLLGVEFVLYWR